MISLLQFFDVCFVFGEAVLIFFNKGTFPFVKEFDFSMVGVWPKCRWVSVFIICLYTLVYILLAVCSFGFVWMHTVCCVRGSRVWRNKSDEGVLTRHQSQVIHGLMRYACGFFSGKHLHQVCAEVMAIGSAPSKKGPAEIRSFCDYAIQMLQTSRPRQIHCGFEKKPILIFTDGCWEAGFAGIGAVISDVATGSKIVCSGVVPNFLIEAWKKSVGDFIICQIELYVMVLLRWQFSRLFAHRRTIWWVDNDSARYSTIKGLSPSPTMRLLAREFYALDADFPTYSWVERVPSKSNPADGPSRNDCAGTLALLSLSSATAFEHPRELVERLAAGLW